MTIPDLIITANKNLLTNKVRTILTILAIFVGAFSIAITAGLSGGIKAFISDQTSQFKAPGILLLSANSKQFDAPSLGSGSTEDSDKLKTYKSIEEETPLITQQKISKLKSDFPDIKMLIPSYNIAVEYVSLNADSPKFNFSVTENVDNVVYNLAHGTVPKNNNQITISSKTAKSLGFNNVQDALGKNLRIVYLDPDKNEIVKNLNIVGVLSSSLINDDVNLVDVSFTKNVNEEVNATSPYQRDNFSIVVAVFDKNISDSKLSEIKNKLSSQGFSSQTLIESVKSTLTLIDQISTVLYIFGAVVLLASIFGVANTLLMSILERTKEIGLMRSLGMSQRGIFTIFSFEAMSLGFWGSFFGCLVVSLGSVFVNNYASQNFLKGVDGYKLIYLDPLSWLAIMSGVMLITFIAGVLPSIKASKQNPITALRSE